MNLYGYNIRDPAFVCPLRRTRLHVTGRILIVFFAELRLCDLVVFCRILIGKSGRISALWSS